MESQTESSVDKAKEEEVNTVNLVSEDSRSSSVMEVDNAASEPAAPQPNDNNELGMKEGETTKEGTEAAQETSGTEMDKDSIDKGKESSNENNESLFVVLEEDDGDDSGEEEDKEEETQKEVVALATVSGEERMDDSAMTSDVVTVVEEEKAEPVKGEEEKAEAEADNSKTDELEEEAKPNGNEAKETLLVNPLFKKPPVISVVPLVDIEDSASSGDSDHEDFSADVDLKEMAFQMDTDEKKEETSEGNRQSCACNCYIEKGILVNEIERLRKAVFELSERHSVLEDYVEVYGDNFAKFLKNREHLVKMGFGLSDPSGEIDGKRSAKAGELVELLKMIKEQAAENEAGGKDENKSDSNVSSTPNKASSGGSGQERKGSSPSQNQSKSRGGGGGSSRSSYPNYSRPSNRHDPPVQVARPIPNLADSYSRSNIATGRGGTQSYVMKPVILSTGGSSIALEYEMQQKLIAMQQEQQAAQSRYSSTFDNKYSNVISGGPPSSSRRDFVTAVPRNDVYSMSSSYRPYYEGASGGHGSDRWQGQDSSKKPRKRKRRNGNNGETSSQTSVSSVSAAPAKTNVPLAPKSIPTPIKPPNLPNKVDDDDVLVLDFEQNMNINSKRLCPVCSKIIARKSLRDHLTVVHQSQKIVCPVCKEEFLQRVRLKTHMKNAHDLPASEYSVFIDHMFQNINLKIGPWLDQMVQEAKMPTVEQLLEFNMASESQKQAHLANQKKTVQGGGPSGARGSAPTAAAKKGGGGGTNAPSTSTGRYFNSGGGKPASTSGNKNSDMYGPGGYAQYAAQYLQQRTSASAPMNRLYTPF